MAAILLLSGGALAGERTRAAERLAEAYNTGIAFADLFSPEIRDLRDEAALEAWRVRMRGALGAFGKARYGRYLGQGQHLYSADFDAGPRDLYLAVDGRGRIAGLMLCDEGLRPLARVEDMRRCSGP